VARWPTLSQGSQLEQPVRGRMERWFGADFTRVRVHTDTDAQRSAEAMHAAAYTVGHNIVFGPGRYVPESVAGSLLLAHELTHVVQQYGAKPVLAPEVVCPSDGTEAEADQAAPVSRLSLQAIQMTPAGRDPTTLPVVSPEEAAREIESLLDQVFLEVDDQRRIIDLLLNVANSRGPGVAPADFVGRVFSRLRADQPSRLKMALHAPIAAVTHADPTYYDLLFDRFDDLPSLISIRDQTTYRGVGSASQMAGQERTRKERQEEEETARFEGWSPGPLLRTPLPRNSQNLFFARKLIERLTTLPRNQLTPEGRYIRDKASEGEDAAIDLLLTSSHWVTPGERRRYFRESVGKATISLLEWLVLEEAAELIAVLPETLAGGEAAGAAAEGTAGAGETEALTIGKPAGETAEGTAGAGETGALTVGKPAGETAEGTAGAGETEALTVGKPAGEGAVAAPVPEAASGATKTASAKAPPAQVLGEEKIGPAYATFEEAFAAKQTEKAHILEVIHTDSKGTEIGHWWEVSEVGHTGRLGDTEQKALMRVKLSPGDHLEMRGTYPPCPQGGGCDIAMHDVVSQTGATITYRTPNVIREYMPATKEWGEPNVSTWNRE
jgi:hypothetical protein